MTQLALDLDEESAPPLSPPDEGLLKLLLPGQFEVSHPEQLMTTENMFRTVWDPYEQYRPEKPKKPHINQSEGTNFEAIINRDGMVIGDRLLREFPNGILFLQERFFEKPLLPKTHHEALNRKKDAQIAWGKSVKVIKVTIGGRNENWEDIWKVSDAPDIFSSIQDALSNIDGLKVNINRHGNLTLSSEANNRARITPLNTALITLMKMGIKPKSQIISARPLTDFYYAATCKIERDVGRKHFTPITTPNGLIAGIGRAYVFTHNGYGVLTYGAFAHAASRADYHATVLGKKSNDDTFQLVKVWHASAFALSRTTEDDEPPKVLTTQTMPDDIFDEMDTAFQSVGSALFTNPDIRIGFTCRHAINAALDAVKSLPPHRLAPTMDEILALHETYRPIDLTREDPRQSSQKSGKLFEGKGRCRGEGPYHSMPK